MSTPGRESVRTDIGSEAWHRDFAMTVNGAIERLARVDVDDFVDVLRDVFAEFAVLLDMVVVGESTPSGGGAVWIAPGFDSAVVRADGDQLRACPDASGPFSIVGCEGARILAAPAHSGGHSRFTAGQPRDATSVGVDVVRGLEVVSSIAGAARQRVVTERELRSRVETQHFLNELSTRAAVNSADEETLQEMLEVARDHFGVSAASTLIRDGDEFVLIATTDYLGNQPVAPGTRTGGGIAQTLELSRSGHLVRGITSFATEPGSLLDSEGEVLCVPRFGPDGVVGLVVFTDVDGRAWSSAEIEAAKSVASSIQKLTLRAESERRSTHRRMLDRLHSDVASVAAVATLDNLDSVVDRTLRMAIECFGIRGAAIWASGGGNNVRIAARWSDGRVSREPIVVPMSDEERRSIVERGHVFVRPTDLRTDELEDVDARGLVVPIGPGPSGMICFFDPDRRWSDEDITACRMLANLADQTRARLHAETLVRARLHDEEFAAAVASRSVDLDLDNVDERLEEMLRLSLDHFGVAEASLWRYEDGRLRCRSAVRREGEAVPAGSEVPVPDLGRLVDRGWMVARLRDLHMGDLVRADSEDARILVSSIDGPEGVSGAFVLTDPNARWWDDRSISSAKSFSDTVSHVQMRMQVARRLVRQQEVDEILASASRAFVDTTLDDADVVVERALEELREHFELAGLTLLELQRPAMTVVCSSEVSDDGSPVLREEFPIPRDHPSIARLLDPGAGPEWRLGDLFAGVEAAEHRGFFLPSVRGRDVQVLVASHRAGAGFGPEARSALSSMIGLLAQLRRRLLLETHARRRADADELVGEIARSFVDQPPYDHERAVARALARIGAFFGVRTISRWRTPEGGPSTREVWWPNPDFAHDMLEDFTTLPDDHPLHDLLDQLGDSGAAELGSSTLDPALAADTIAVQRVSQDGAETGLLVALTPRPPHLVVDLDIQRDVLARVSRLIEQLLRRADSDLAVARQLHHEDLLRRFATSMVDIDAEAVETVENTLRDLMAGFGVDHATIWHWQPDDDGFLVEAVLHVVDGDAGPLDEKYLRFRLPSGYTDPAVAPHFADEASAWDLDDAPAGMQEMIRESLPAGARQVAFLPAPGNDPQGDSTYLVLTRPGTTGFRNDELEFFRSVHSILIQHDARVSAERWFSAAFNSAPIGITLRSADRKLIHCNAAYEELVGRRAEELKGTTIRDVVPEETEDERAALSPEGPAGMRQFESAYRRPDGTMRWASVRTTPVRLPGRREPLMLTYVEDITDRRRNREMLEYQATHDELTGLPNRRALVGEIASELEAPGDCAVLVLDLDRFKVVNDSLGHSVGDQLLITCADRIRLSLRPGDSVCRLGGDEFAILLRAPADPHAAGVVAERLLSLLREPVTIGDDEVYPSASIGVALPQPGDSVEDLLRHADAAMYQAKGQGRDGWEVFDGSMRLAVVDRVRTETDLRRAIDNGQLEVHYQPEFLLDTGEIVGSEALVRWRHPERGLLAAGSFISLAEETGLVVDLGRWVLSQATRQGAQWLRDGHDIITRVNLSARQLRGAVVAEVEAALAEAALPADRLCLELTETAIMDDVQESARILARFRELGVQVAIDDFGTGFSSLAYLKRFPVDILKIDRTFVDGVGVDPDDTAIVRSVIGLARTLRLEVVAEGIEDATQLGELVRLGCGRGQGFHLARPAPAEEVSRLLAENRAERDAPARE